MADLPIEYKPESASRISQNKTLSIDRSGFAKTFPQKLFELLSSEEPVKEIIAWMASGDSFIIFNEASFAEQVLPKFFSRTKFTSFIGKLYRWGFRRITKGNNAGAYYNKHFVKGKPELCLQMRREMSGCKERKKKHRKKMEQKFEGMSNNLAQKSNHDDLPKQLCTSRSFPHQSLALKSLLPEKSSFPKAPLAFASSEQTGQALLNFQPSYFLHMGNFSQDRITGTIEENDREISELWPSTLTIHDKTPPIA